MLAQHQLLGPELPENRLRFRNVCISLLQLRSLAGVTLPETEWGVCCCAVEPKQSIPTNGVRHVI